MFKKSDFSEMSFRTFGHLLRYGEPSVRRAVPLAIALTSVSNPQLHIIDTLSKFSHDSDGEVAYNGMSIAFQLFFTFKISLFKTKFAVLTEKPICLTEILYRRRFLTWLGQYKNRPPK